jgi:hypothetical protein
LAEHEGERGMRHYIRMTSDYESRERTILKDIYNRRENKHGGLIHVVFISSASTVGLTFHNTRHAIAMEPHWLWNQIYQYFQRFNRFGCQNDFAESDRRLSRTLLLADFPVGYKESEEFTKERNKLRATNESTAAIDMTTDEQIYESAMIKERQNALILRDCEMVSLECMIGVKAPGECRICAPTGEVLFVKDFHANMKLPSRCNVNAETKVTVEQIMVNGKTYYYNYGAEEGGPVNVYSFDEDVDGYVALLRDSDEYQIVAKMIEKI